jgi:hypothetical protein
VRPPPSVTLSDANERQSLPVTPTARTTNRRGFVYCHRSFMPYKIAVHAEPDGGYWAEVPAIPGCATQGETFEELLKNLYEAVEGCLKLI